MHFPKFKSSAFVIGTAILVEASCSPCPFDITPIVTGTILIGKPLKPIPVPGGVRIISPIIGGTLSGVINATIEGGMAYPYNTENGTVSAPQILLYGTTSDNSSFLIQEAGIGSRGHQNTRIILEIGGKSAYLMDEFIIASVVPSQDRKSVAIKAYIVQ